MGVDDWERTEPASRAELRAWLAANHASSPGAVVVHLRSSTGETTVSYDEIVEECLCFGWIDSKTRGLDERRLEQTISPRRKGGMWAATNKARIERLSAEGLIESAGAAVIEEAKADGSWEFLDDIEALIVPDDLAAALADDPAAAEHFAAFPPGAKKAILLWVKTAKKPETRAARIETTVAKAARGERAAG